VTVSPLHFLWTVLFLIPVIGCYTIVLGTASLASSLWDRTGRFAHGCARAWSRLILATSGVRVEVRGLERLEPGTTYVFVANHQSLYDIPVIFWWLPFQLRIIAKESLGSFPFLGWHLRRTGHLLVDRRNPDRGGILRKWRGLLEQGLSLIIFPEGTRSEDGRVGRFRAGSFMLAIEARLPIVPIALVGTRRCMRKGRLTVRPAFVEMTIHAPISLDSGAWSPTIEDARRLAASTQDLIAASIEASERARQP
jgi:1-acyl-sn-glycerol-3-phosphate acyltransferase